MKPLPTEPLLTLVFSKDRAMQLDATLRSLRLHCGPINAIALHVLFRATTPMHQAQYAQLAREYPIVEFMPETDFREQLLNLLQQFSFILFVVDDNFFLRRFSPPAIVQALNRHPRALGFSLRLGKNTIHCYSLRIPQRVPSMRSAGRGIVRLKWWRQDGDFGYPLEVSSSVYRVADVIPLMSAKVFRNPNELEGLLARQAVTFRDSHPELLCYDRSAAFCNPINMVQTVFTGNRTGNNAVYSAERLAQLFQEGQRIRIDVFRRLIPLACHQELPLELFRPAV